MLPARLQQAEITVYLTIAPLALSLCAAPSAAADNAGSVTVWAQKLAPLIDPAKLATLGKRGANPRVEKAVYWLSVASSNSAAPEQVADLALKTVHMAGAAAALTEKALLRDLGIAGKLGCLDPADLAEMRRGRCPIVRRGPYLGDKLSVDHIIPFAVCPELDHVIANLELMPLRMNESKGDKIGARQIDLARRLHSAGLLSEAGEQRVERAPRFDENVGQ